MPHSFGLMGSLDSLFWPANKLTGKNKLTSENRLTGKIKLTGKNKLTGKKQADRQTTS